MRSTFRAVAVAGAMLLIPIVATDAQQAPPQPADCAQAAPVCALNNGTRQTYWNACSAARDRAELLYTGECRTSRSYGMNTKLPALTRF